MRRHDVLHVVAPAAVGGLEHVVQSLAVAQRDRGNSVCVAAVVGPGERSHPFIVSARAAGLDVLPLEIGPRGYLEERRQVARLCARLQPRVVHTHGYRPDVLDAPVARAGGAAVVSTVHGFTGGDWKNRLFEMLDRRALRRFDAVVAVSRAQMEQLRQSGVAADRLVHIPNAWTVREPPLDRAAARAQLGIAPDAWVMGWVGRLTAEKGPDVFIEALAQVRRPAWTALVLGDGSRRPDLEAQAAALALGSRVRWCGVVPGAGRLYAAFDVFVLSSRTEGIPIVLFEAMAARTPIVATRVGGVPDVVTDREAVLAPSGEPAALAAAIDAVAADPRAAAARAAAAHDVLSRRFAIEPWLAAYDTAYERAVARRGAES